MKILLALLLTSCVYVEPSPRYEPAPEPTKPKVHNVGECFEFIKASKESWENQPQVIVKIITVGKEKYLVEVVSPDYKNHQRLGTEYFMLENKDPIPCP